MSNNVEFKKFYAVNNIDTHLILKGGFIDIPHKGFKTILEEDLKHPDVMDAITKEWITISREEPKTKRSEVTFNAEIQTEGYKGLTAAELQEVLQTEDEAKSGATVEALGKGGTVSGEATSERIGQTAEEANSAKPGRKTAK